MKAVDIERATTITNPEAVDPGEVVQLLRSAVLRLSPHDIDFEPGDRSPQVWGVVVETAHPDAIASLIAMLDGSVSLYVSDGTGCVGCGGNREVRYAAADMIEVAERCLGRSTPTDDRDYPPAGYVRFYFLSVKGLMSMQLPIEELNTVDVELGALYFAGQRVINAIERAGAGQSIEQEIRLAQLAESPSPSTAARPAPLQSTSVQGSPACLSVGNAVHRLRR